MHSMDKHFSSMIIVLLTFVVLCIDAPESIKMTFSGSKERH